MNGKLVGTYCYIIEAGGYLIIWKIPDSRAYISI